MAAMVGEHVVVVAKVLYDRDRIGLLADARVRGAVEQTALEQPEQALLKAADEAHPAVQALGARLAGRAHQTSVCPGHDRGSGVRVPLPHTRPSSRTRVWAPALPFSGGLSRLLVVAKQHPATCRCPR